MAVTLEGARSFLAYQPRITFQRQPRRRSTPPLRSYPHHPDLPRPGWGPKPYPWGQPRRGPRSNPRPRFPSLRSRCLTCNIFLPLGPTSCPKQIPISVSRACANLAHDQLWFQCGLGAGIRQRRYHSCEHLKSACRRRGWFLYNGMPQLMVFYGGGWIPLTRHWMSISAYRISYNPSDN